MHGRLRAQPGAVVARRRPAGLQRQAARARTGRGSRRSWPGAIRRVPAIADAGVSRMINGPEAFTPDNEFILGESEVRGFFVAAGFCAHGIAGAGGIGRQVAPAGSSTASRSSTSGRWTSAGSAPQYRSQAFTLARTTEVYATYYDIHYPNEERQAGRPLRLSPAYARLGRARAPSSARSPAGSARTGSPRTSDAGARGRSGRAAGPASTGRPAIGAEALATREAAGLFDESSFAKIEVAGPGACAFLQRLCAQRRRRRRRADRLHPDAQPARRHRGATSRSPASAADRFLHRDRDGRSATTTSAGSGSTCPTTARSRSATSRRPGPASGCGVRGRATSSRRSRKDDVSNEAFPYLTAREISVGNVPVLALRVTYVGELGWELYPPTEYGAALWDTLWEAGAGHGLVAGRLPGDRRAPAREGLPRLVERHHARTRRRTRPGSGSRSRSTRADFIGRDALVAAKAAGPRKRLRCLVLDDPRSVCLGNEPVRVDGEVVGRVTSGGYGFAVERSIAYAYLPPDAGDRDPRRDRRVRRVGRLRGRARAALGPGRRADRGRERRTAAFGPEWSAGLRRGTEAELDGWLELAHAACDEADELARAHFRRDLEISTKPDRTFVTAGRHRDRAGDPGADRGRVTRTTASSARSTGPRPATRRPAGTSTRSTAPTTSSAACRCSGRCSRSSATASSRPRVLSAPGAPRALVGAARRRSVGARRRRRRRRAGSTCRAVAVARRRPAPLRLRPRDRGVGPRAGLPGAARRRLARARVRRLLGLRAAGRGRRRGDGRGRPVAVGRRGADGPRRGGRRPGDGLRRAAGDRQRHVPRVERPPPRRRARTTQNIDRMRIRGRRSLWAAVSTTRRNPTFSNIGVTPT